MASKKALIRSLNRRGTRADMSPPVTRKTARLKEPAICERCAAIFQRKTWRSGRKLTGTLLERATWTVCPACAQTKGRDEYYGKVVAHGLMGSPTADQALRRIQNVGRQAEATQPEHRVLSLEWNGDVLEVLTTSQKVAHRIAHELKKAFGGTTTYSWSEGDGTLLAVWKIPAPSTKKRASSRNSSRKQSGAGKLRK